jgi:hypothetical protein
MAEADTDFQFDVALVAATREPSDDAGSAVRHREEHTSEAVDRRVDRVAAGEARARAPAPGARARSGALRIGVASSQHPACSIIESIEFTRVRRLIEFRRGFPPGRTAQSRLNRKQM